ncbi:MAG TPA: T9SS type A sorting domain-containing protein [Bacteroidaceae bacterium]|nr:T9SS type A sorting domain-containing protein [Bacteroidaceae bacterium]
MKKIYLSLIVFLAGTLSYGQTLIVGQDFDSDSSWAFTPDPQPYNEDGGKDVWASVTTLGTSNNGLDAAQNGVNFWGMRDLDNPYIETSPDSVPPGLGLSNPYDHKLVFKNVSVSGKTNMEVSFYYNAYSLNDGYLNVEFFYDNVSQGEDTIFSDASGTATDGGWVLYSKVIPDGTDTLGMTIHAYNNQDYLALDNIRLVGVDGGGPTCELVLGTNTAVCDAVTAGTDTYTATIEYTGGGTETFSVTSTGGTVGGDDPSTVAAGSIIVTGVEEGTDIIVTITSTACDEEVSITAPTCIPEIPLPELPIVEHFNYAEGISLIDTDWWFIDGSGDSVKVAAGNLSYPYLEASSGNSVTLVGEGSEAELRFDTVTAGKVYFSFIFKVTDMTNWTKGGYPVFLGSFDARLNIQPIGNQFGIGIAKKNSLETVIWLLDGEDSVKFDLNSEVFVVMNYDVEAGTSDVWVNPAEADMGIETAPDYDIQLPDGNIVGISKFVIRQDSDEETPTVVIDEVRVGLSWASVTPKGESSSIPELKNSGFTVYPNPVSDGYFSIQTQSNSDKNLKVYDVVGKKVFEKIVQPNQRIDVSNLKTGLYFISLEEDGLIFTGKLIIK